MMEYIIVQAGGKGTRLGELTQNKPKALVPVENCPMLFHLFRKYPDKRFIIIADYHREVLHAYLDAFAEVKYQIVDAGGTGTCAGVKQALEHIPDGEAFMLVWSDLILPEAFALPEEYGEDAVPVHDYVGISTTFPCRWSYQDGIFKEERSAEHGVAGFFLFTDKNKLADVPQSGELVRWMQQQGASWREVSLAGTREFGLLEEYKRLAVEKCRPFNRITVEGDVLVKEPVDEQGVRLAKRECAWYEKAGQAKSRILPKIYGTEPLRMEYIRGKNIYECDLERQEKRRILEKLVSALQELHGTGQVPADSFSVREAYYNKTMSRLSKIEDLVPFAREREIVVNGKRCRNVFFHRRELEEKLGRLRCSSFRFIHGDCTFSNLMLREDGSPVLIDPRGYFGFTELYGDPRYDWAKLYYSLVGNYDRFNLKRFRLAIGATAEEGVRLEIESNHWEDLEEDFFALTGADREEIRLLHAVIWLSLTTYAWQDYDSICGAFYNGLYYLEDVL
jgi:thiamine kinase-like enzyme